jgi:hypothetical protein
MELPLQINRIDVDVDVFKINRFVKMLKLQWERIVLLTLLICFYAVMNLKLWLNFQHIRLSTYTDLLVYSTITEVLIRYHGCN